MQGQCGQDVAQRGIRIVVANLQSWPEQLWFFGHAGAHGLLLR